MDSINERIQIIINSYFRGNVKAFSDYVGINYQTIANIVGKRQSTPNGDILGKMVKAIDKLNARWLLTGEGEILKTNIVNNLYKLEFTPLVNKYSYNAFILNYNDDLFLKSLHSIPILKGINDRRIYITFEISGNALDANDNRSILNGDIVVAFEDTRKTIQDTSSNHDINILLSKEYGIIFGKVERIKQEPFLTIIPLNKSYNATKVLCSDVIKIYRISQIIRGSL